MDKKDPGKIIVIGCGPIGMLTAIALKKLGFSLVLIGSKVIKNDDRTTACMLKSIEFFKKLNLWEKLYKHAAPLSILRIIDGTSRILRSPSVNFSAKELGEEAFGYNIENKKINEILENALSEIKHIEANVKTIENNSCILNNGQIIKSDLILAADGKDSVVRKALKIEINKQIYPQTALVLKFAHEYEHNNICTEIHNSTGPFTQVPLLGKYSSLIWTVNKTEEASLKKLSISELNMLIAEKLYYSLGKVNITSTIQWWPISSFIAQICARNNVILLGEAAHGFPPIGAQGLNLSIRDIETLCDILMKKPKDIIKTYNELRMPDIKTRSLAVNSLNRSLLSNNFSWQLIRALGFSGLKHSSFLRKFFMKEGISPSNLLLKFGSNIIKY